VPTRLFDIYAGMHHGWVLNGWQRSWSRPQTYFDNVPRVVELGRGSPTGLTVYRHTAFPKKYRGGVFSCCWTLGRVYHLPLLAEGSTFKGTREVFLQTTGETGFAPVDLAVGTAGEMYVAIGGRRTRGSVFRITAPGSATESPAASAPLQQVLAAPQPLASWSRAKWEPLIKQLSERDLLLALADDRRSTDQRIRAVEVLTECFSGLKQPPDFESIADYPVAVAARLAWSLGRVSQGKQGAKLLARLSHDPRPSVMRAAFTAIANLPAYSPELEAANWQAIDEGADRAVRTAALLAEVRRGEDAPPLKLSPLSQLWVKQFRKQLTPEDFAPAAREFLRATQWPRKPAEALEAIRLMELCLGDLDTEPKKQEVYSGYALRADAETIARVSRPFHAPLAETFGETEWNVDYELARLCAMLGVEHPQLVERIVAAKCTEESETRDDLHFLIALSHLPGPRSEKATRFSALALSHLQSKMRSRAEFPSRNWPERVLEAFEQLLARDPNLGTELLEIGEFLQPGNAFLVSKLAPLQRLTATRLLLKRGRELDDDDERWNTALVSLLGELPAEEAYPALREAWENFGLRDEVVKQLARQPHNDDRGRFVKALGSVNPQTVMTACQALLKLDLKDSDADVAAAAAALRQACTTPDYINVRRNIVKLLNAWTEEEFGIEEPRGTPLLAAYQPVFDWLARHRPEAWQRVTALGGGSLEEWQARLAQVDWSAGDAERGKLVFQKRSCLKCHAGQSPLGPDLAGAAARFSREDLFTAILDPSKDVAPPYQTTQLVTRSGRMVHGLVIYESPDSTLIQTDPETTVRIAGDEIQLFKKSRQSLMPTGLLNGAGAEELADLYAYLRTLTGKR
jgi:putative heme-binding domain-containing protein